MDEATKRLNNVIASKKYGSFSEEEKRKLIDAVNEYLQNKETINFAKISHDVFQTQKTPKALKNFYYMFLNNNNGRMEWTRDKLEKLHEFVHNQLLSSETVDWHRISSCMEIPAMKCKWAYHRGPLRRVPKNPFTGALTCAEREKLRTAAKSYRNESGDIDFEAIASSVFEDTRTPTQLTRYYSNHLSSEITHKSWTPEEIKLLEELVKKWKHTSKKRVSWLEISKGMGGRSPLQCSNKYGSLTRKSNK